MFTHNLPCVLHWYMLMIFYLSLEALTGYGLSPLIKVTLFFAGKYCHLSFNPAKSFILRLGRHLFRLLIFLLLIAVSMSTLVHRSEGEPNLLFLFSHVYARHIDTLLVPSTMIGEDICWPTRTKHTWSSPLYGLRSRLGVIPCSSIHRRRRNNFLIRIRKRKYTWIILLLFSPYITYLSYAC